MSQDFRAGMMAGALLTAILLAGFVALSSAQTYLVFSGIAQHLDGSSHCNNHFTPGLGVEHKSYAVGVYQNSNCDTSWYAASIWTPLKLGYVRLGGITGLVTGYRSSAIPVGGAVATYERETWGVNLIFIPPYKDSGNVLWLQFKVPFS